MYKKQIVLAKIKRVFSIDNCLKDFNIKTDSLKDYHTP